MHKNIIFIIEEITKLFPNARCELNYGKDYELLIAIMLSAQTTDKAVNKVTSKLFSEYTSIDDYINTDINVIENDIKQLGLYKKKARNIKEICISIKNNYNGCVLNDQKILESLPGVGRKTANVFRSVWFNEPRFAVDTHVSRVSKRLKLVDINDNVNDIEKKLTTLIDKNLWIDMHHKFIFFGRYFCTARNPKCNKCPFVNICDF